MNILESDMILSNLLLGFVFIIIGFYVLSALIELLSNFLKINISIFDPLIGFFINRKNGEMILQKLVGNIYSVFIEVLLWVIPISCAITAGIYLKGFHWGILGAIAGIFIDVLLYGVSIILLNIRSSLKNINK